MKIIKQALLILTGFCFLTTGYSQVTGQWRGENRDGIYHGTNLMKEWPEKGPSLVWSAENIGNGYSSPVVSGDVLVVNGETDGTGYLCAFNLQGELLWKTPYGLEYPQNDTSSEQFPGPRSTPTIAGDLVYFCSGLGKICCFELRNGTEKWSVDMVGQLNGLIHTAGYAESLLIDGDIVYCYPGGSENNVAALNRFTGQTIWTSKAMGDSVSFCSPLIVNLPERKVLINMTSKNFSGLDAQTGELLWYQTQENVRYNNQFATPLYANSDIYYVAQSINSLIKLEINDEGKGVKELWRTGDIRSGLHSPVKAGDFIYYSDDRQKIKSIDINTGKVADSLRVFRGPLFMADDRLICYSENGNVSLIGLEASKMHLISSFKVDKGTREHLAQPFIDKGVMYIRHGNALLAYDISND
jgi:outer membrane protein assembly factor BamB